MATSTIDQSSSTVTVACKLPHGLVLAAYDMVEDYEPVMAGGTRKITKARRIPGEFVVAGNTFEQGKGPKGPLDFGFAMTHGCPKDLWDRWLESHKDTPMVKNGLIFAFGAAPDAKAKAREMENTRTGFERLDPAKLPGGVTKAAT